MAVFYISSPGVCAQRCVGNDTCGCFEGYKLKPDEKTCEGMSPLKDELFARAESARERGVKSSQSLRFCIRTLLDINECLLGASNCRGGERCINTEGSFRCQREVSCGTGYELTDNNNCKGEWDSWTAACLKFVVISVIAINR